MANRIHWWNFASGASAWTYTASKMFLCICLDISYRSYWMYDYEQSFYIHLPWSHSHPANFCVLKPPPPPAVFCFACFKCLEGHDALNLVTFSAFKGCRLKRVNLRRCNNVNDVWLTSMTSSSLRCLDLASCSQITDTGLSQVIFSVNEVLEVILKLFLTS